MARITIAIAAWVSFLAAESVTYRPTFTISATINAIMNITTSSSISVKPSRRRRLGVAGCPGAAKRMARLLLLACLFGQEVGDIVGGHVVAVGPFLAVRTCRPQKEVVAEIVAVAVLEVRIARPVVLEA